MGRVLIVVPTYMEIDNIERLIRRVRAALPEGDILVVDDNSPDGTADRAEALGTELGQVEVLRRQAKTGLGDAYRAALTWGLARDVDVFVSMDADFSHDPDDIPRLIAAYRSGADMVIGSRYVLGGGVETAWPRRRKAFSRWANRYVRLALATGVADNTAGFRVYRSDLVRRIQLQDSRADGYAFQIEAVYRATSARARIDEVPVFFTDRAAGVSKLSSRTIVEALALVTWWGVKARTRRQQVVVDPAGTTR